MVQPWSLHKLPGKAEKSNLSKTRRGGALTAQARVGSEGCGYVRQEGELREHLISAATGPVADEAELVAVLEPGGGLFDGGLLDVRREGGLAGSR